jgi:hypothetical protein
MENGHDYRQLVFKMAEASQPEMKSWIKFRETIGTAILGTISTSVGVVVLINGVADMLRGRRVESHDPMLLNSALGAAAVVGAIIGLAGLTLGRVRNSTISPLATLGTAVCLIQIYLSFGQFVMMLLQR